MAHPGMVRAYSSATGSKHATRSPILGTQGVSRSRTRVHSCLAVHAGRLVGHPPYAAPVRAGWSYPVQELQRSIQRGRGVSRRATQILGSAEVKYDAVKNAQYWKGRVGPVAVRLAQIGLAFTHWLVKARIHHDKKASAAALRETLTHLGPAFVKIGQALSSRPDIMDPDYLRELEKLQDRIPSFSDEEAFAVIEQELGQPVTDVFLYISDQPVAAASLGQVYRARLRSSGEEVAVKVQRPGVMTRIALDVYILRQLAFLVRRLRNLNTDLPLLVDEWATSLFRELDYTREAANGRRFKATFSHMTEVYVPHMYDELTSTKVLTMEWVEGERLRTASALDRLSGDRLGSEEDLHLVEVGVRCSLEQMLEEGFYHADPHPGNLLKTKNGQLCYLDFGMMGEIDRPIRQGLMRATLHLVNREYASLADDFITLGLLPEGSIRSEIIPALTGVFQEALKEGVSNLSFSDLSGNLGRTMYQYKFRIPPYYTLLVRSLSVLEGIALASDPQYKVLRSAYPWVARRLLTEKSEELRGTLRALLYKDGRFQFKRLESLLKQAVRSPGKGQTWSDFAQQRGGYMQGAAMKEGTSSRPSPAGEDALSLLLSEEGDFVREILTDELAKGMDAAWRLAVDGALKNTRETLASGLFGLPLPFLGRGNIFIPPGVSLIQSLLAWPSLSGAADREQVEGIARLAKVMYSLADGEVPQGSGSTSAALVNASSQISTQERAGQNRVLLPTTPGRRDETPRLSSRSGSGAAFDNEAATARTPSRSQSGVEYSSGSQPSGGSNAGQTLVSSVNQAASMLTWLAREIQVLPPEARREALGLPISIISKLSSRITARAVRWALGGSSGATEEPFSSTSARTSSSSSTTSYSTSAPLLSNLPNPDRTSASQGARAFVPGSSSTNASTSSSSTTREAALKLPVSNGVMKVDKIVPSSNLTATSQQRSPAADGVTASVSVIAFPSLPEAIEVINTDASPTPQMKSTSTVLQQVQEVQQPQGGSDASIAGKAEAVAVVADLTILETRSASKTQGPGWEGSSGTLNGSDALGQEGGATKVDGTRGTPEVIVRSR